MLPSLIFGALFAVSAIMLATFRSDIWAWLKKKSDAYPPRWYWPVVNIYGGPDGQESREIYMTRVLVGPATRWGQAYLHIFHRKDSDRDPHDHPFDFWTIPLNQSYIEEVFDHEHGQGCFKSVRVPRWRRSFRPSTHSHRVVATASGRWPLVTAVWRSTNKRPWGFWAHSLVYGGTQGKNRYFVPWKDYVYDGVNANVDGIDEACPGVGGGRFNGGSK